jgi:hypothetical protein
VVATTKKAVMIKPQRPGVTWSSESPARNDGEGEGGAVVARTRSKWCTVIYLLWYGPAYFLQGIEMSS